MHAEDVDVRVPGDAFLDVGVEFQGEFLALFRGLGHVHHLCALGFGHRGRRFVGLVFLGGGVGGGFVLDFFLFSWLW